MPLRTAPLDFLKCVASLLPSKQTALPREEEGGRREEGGRVAQAGARRPGQAAHQAATARAGW